MRWTGLHLALLITVLCAGQDADTIVLKDRGASSFALVSQILDRNEANAFLEIIEAKAPEQRSQLAKDFITAYPQSWLLAQALDAAARSAIDLSNYGDALDYARFSIRLMPENPSLLVLLANLEGQRGVDGAAVQDAADALEYLDAIERPGNVKQKEWDATKPQLKASAWFARGRAEAAEGLAHRPHDSQALSMALRDLNEAAAWNSSDPETFYLRAIVELQLGRNSQAVSDLAFVRKCDHPLREKADKVLLVLAKGAPLESFLKQTPPPEIDASLRSEAPRVDRSKAIADGYAGPDACRSCHSSEYGAWRKTGMARMLRPYRPENILGNFSTGTLYKESGADLIRMGTHGRPYFEVFSAGAWQRFYVDYTIGSKWQQGYATKLPDGRLQVLPIEYNLLQRSWVNYWRIIDPPGSARAVIHDFPKMSSVTNYQENCAICHTSQLKLNTAETEPMQHAAFLQAGVDCEMCHGPAAGHARGAAKGDLAELPFDFRKATNRDGVRVCAQCHRQSAVREIGEGGEMNYSADRDFVPKTQLRSYDAFSRKAFYKDGRFRETTFIVEAFTRSACYRLGTAQCASCHSPHESDFEHNLTSLKHSDAPNEICLSCHSGFRDRVTAHSHHPASSEASRCVTCHMPKIVNAVLFKARSHQIEVPTADLTERFGQDESPNVCLTCHSEKPASWAKEQLAAWRN